ncbi:hypothetical protein ACLB0R_03045 [Sphingomonas sp. GlSt437]|uniref:hypothetical protein n=1 Tax=Sphingomonas sp. GlSt437 TaxID=3389970 RepID=UPI003A87859C
MKHLIAFGVLSLVASAASAQRLAESVGGSPAFVSTGLADSSDLSETSHKVWPNTLVCFERKADHHAVCKRMAEWRRIEAELAARKTVS